MRVTGNLLLHTFFAHFFFVMTCNHAIKCLFMNTKFCLIFCWLFWYGLISWDYIYVFFLGLKLNIVFWTFVLNIFYFELNELFYKYYLIFINKFKVFLNREDIILKKIESTFNKLLKEYSVMKPYYIQMLHFERHQLNHSSKKPLKWWDQIQN